ncbi:MAG: 50S ribosomal protein L23 [Proteobacteria bacterium]|nr:50S ribosomal protein L23 [Pseudomonadota bacterium]
MNHYEVVKRPIITEKTTLQKETINQVTFEVDRKANRIEIKKAVEQLFNVGVDKVSTVQVKGKRKQRGRILGKRRDWKKAIVKLKPGARIEFFEGV